MGSVFQVRPLRKVNAAPRGSVILSASIVRIIFPASPDRGENMLTLGESVSMTGEGWNTVCVSVDAIKFNAATSYSTLSNASEIISRFQSP